MEVNVMLVAAIGFLLGIAIGVIILFAKLSSDKKKLANQADDIVKKAKERAREIRSNANRDAKSIVRDERNALEKEYREKTKKLSQNEKDLAKKEIYLEQKIEEQKKEDNKIRQKEEDLALERKKVEDRIVKYNMAIEEYTQKLSSVSGMSKDDVKKELIDIYTEEAKLDAAQMIKQIEEEAEDEAEKRSKRILGIAIQRFAGEFVAEQTISSVELPGDDIKGRLIGREGRNIRAFEQICGVDLVIDDTPGIVVISSFNVVRKEIARMTITRLIADGRIHPAKIEEFYEKSKVQFESRLRDLGEKAQMEIGVHGIHPEILKMIGALNWRTSYMQNQYQHSLEVGFLCGAMASELGMNVKQARRAGLLHDIGKVMDASQEGSHAMVGADFLKKYGESPDIIHAIRAHHEDVKPETVLAHLVMAADALSASRPGVRKFLKESYVSRISDIESIANSFDGVRKSYAISAGREIRVLVENEKITDEQTVVLSRDIAKKIEEEMSYPGSIKVSVIRETRSVGIAK
ncbi:MAG: ribonuclease Y [Halobacteriovoraceae bacterium]|nr:ribonuclease Y [Halobacteriovoraceae bacterium]